MVSSFLEGDVETSRAIQLRALPLIHALFCEVNPIPVKTACNMLGWNVGKTRMPLCEMEPAHADLLRKAMKEYGLNV